MRVRVVMAMIMIMVVVVVMVIMRRIRYRKRERRRKVAVHVTSRIAIGRVRRPALGVLGVLGWTITGIRIRHRNRQCVERIASRSYIVCKAGSVVVVVHTIVIRWLRAVGNNRCGVSVDCTWLINLGVSTLTSRESIVRYRNRLVVRGTRTSLVW